MYSFNRSDICEAYWFYACNFGEYSILTRLENLRFRMSPIATLTGERVEPYLELVAKKAPDSYESEKFRLVTVQTTDYRRLKLTQLVTAYTRTNLA